MSTLPQQNSPQVASVQSPPTVPEPVAHPQQTVNPYHTVADTVGLVPNLRWKDNVFQAAFIFAALIVGLVIGYFVGDLPGLFVGAIIGLIAGTLLSGITLMVIGWIRAILRK